MAKRSTPRPRVTINQSGTKRSATVKVQNLPEVKVNPAPLKQNSK